MKKFLEIININLISEYVAYIYIAITFLNPKLNMKLGYVLVILGIIKIIFYKEKININKRVYGMFILIFIIGCITNIISSKSDGLGYFVKENSKFIYSAFLFLFITKKEQLKKVDYSIVLGILFLCIGILYIKSDWFINGSIGRRRAVLVIGIVYLLINYFESIIDKKYINIYIIPLILSIYTIIFLNSRMAILSIVLSIILYIPFMIMYRKNYGMKKILLVLIIGGMIIFKFTPSSYVNHLKTSFKTSNNISNEDRIIMWKAGVEIFLENKLFGIGNDSEDAIVLVQKYVDKNVKSEILRKEFLSYPRFGKLHNMYIDFFVQNGIFGILYFILLFFIIPKEVYTSKKDKMIITLFFSLISFYIYGITWSIWSGYGIVHSLFQNMLALMLINIQIINSEE